MELFTVVQMTALSSEKRREFEELLPELVEKIIRNSCNDLEDLRIPGGEDIWINGFDGIIQCNKGDDFVPAGKSVWEFGNSADPIKKAEEDYQKRVEQTSAELRKDITFCFVTTKIWNSSKSPMLEWILKHNDWKRTCIYDAPVLCDRINRDPAIYAWLLEEIYHKPLNFTSAYGAWDRFSQKTAPPLVKAVFLKERSELQDLFFRALAEKTNTVVMADTSIEASGFILSAILESPQIADWG